MNERESIPLMMQQEEKPKCKLTLRHILDVAVGFIVLTAVVISIAMFF